MPETPDYEMENDVLELAEDIVNYVLNELRENREDWYFRFAELPDEGKKMLFTALADGFGDSTEE